MLITVLITPAVSMEPVLMKLRALLVSVKMVLPRADPWGVVKVRRQVFMHRLLYVVTHYIIFISLYLLLYADIDECSSADLNTCDTENGICVNTDGNYTCECSDGFTGNGSACTGMYVCL